MNYLHVSKLAWCAFLFAGICRMDGAEPASPHPTVIKEYEQVFTTYPYSDPDPVPAMTRVYPYFRYDDLTVQPVQKKWKVIELSNDYVTLLILPEIGGKVWAAMEKTTGKPFIYYNHVVKFRELAMRGPWTSGGMELNYGIIGHTPNCATPVDYVVRQNGDGGASCIIGVLDLLTRTTWRVEIKLPADQACFTTSSLWHNSSGVDEPYYTWSNVAIKSAGNLQLMNRGTNYIDHDGKAFSWPVNPKNGRNLSWYNQNNFDSHKSYHVIGRLAEFYGGYWHDDDFGMARYATYNDKPGQKVWLWSQSPSGGIWEKHLTDTDGQYVEVQSGRLFNQSLEKSSVTPFKHKEFSPYATDTWTEYWMPVKGTKGFVSASPWGAMNVSEENGHVIVRLSPVRFLQDKLEVFDGDRLLHSQKVTLRPMEALEVRVALSVPAKHLRVCLGDDKLEYAAGDDDVLSRPIKSPADFDWSSTYGLYLRGKEEARKRSYATALPAFQACLKTDPNFLPALVEMAALADRRADYAEAGDFARRALSIDAYDPGANYHFGLASAALGRSADAKAAFSIAALSAGWRNAAMVELAKEFLREKRCDRALAGARESLISDGRNLDAYQLQACILRLQGDAAGAATVLRELLNLDPLNHLANFERYLLGTASAQDFTGMIRNDLPQETYLELAAWYRNVGLDREANQVLELAPPNAEVLYWRAYLRRDPRLLAEAEQASPAFVLPFRIESIPVFEWACGQSGAWQPQYYLALIRWHLNQLAQARQLLSACGDAPRFGPFYATRAQVCPETIVRDLQKAAEVDPTQWRYGVMLADYYVKQGNPAAVLVVAEDYARRFSTNPKIILLRAKALVITGHGQAALDLLAPLVALPGEGNLGPQAIYREACLGLAVDQMKAKAFDQALRYIAKARDYPENLGVGKPYPDDSDERLENWLAYQCQVGLQAPAEARKALHAVLAFHSLLPDKDANEVVAALALKQAGRTAEGEQLLNAWLKEAPASDAAKWGRAVLAGQVPPIPAGLDDATIRILSASFQMKR